MVKGLILDYGGTVDTGGRHWSEVIWDAWNMAGIIEDKETFREVYVYAERELARTETILPAHDFNHLLKIKLTVELQRLTEMGKFSPGEIESKADEVAGICMEFAKNQIENAKPVLKMLAEKYPVVLVSNFYGNLETVLKQFGLTGYFKKTIDSAKAGVRKPDPEIFRMGVQALGLQPSEVLVVGDSMKNDIIPAHEAGCQTMLLKGDGFDEQVSYDFKPKVIEKLGEVLEFV